MAMRKRFGIHRGMHHVIKNKVKMCLSLTVQNQSDRVETQARKTFYDFLVKVKDTRKIVMAGRNFTK